jgi:hypothetical protein
MTTQTTEKIALLDRPKIKRGRIIVDGDINIDISTTRDFDEIMKPSNVVMWLEMAKTRIVNLMIYDDVE